MNKSDIPVENFGVHLMVDAYKCDPAILDNANLLYDFLDTLPGILEMHKLTLPYLVHAVGNGQHDPGGWSGFVMIEESHISLHSFVKRGFITIDAYSCKPFDTEKTLEVIRKTFKTDDLDYHVEPRGTRYPKLNVVK